MRRNHLSSAIPSPALAIDLEPLAEVVARHALRPQCRIGDRQTIRKRRTQQTILHRAPKRRHPHAIDLLKHTRRLRTQQPTPHTQCHRTSRFDQVTRPEQIIRQLQTPQKCCVIPPKRPIGMKPRKPLDGPPRPLRRHQRIPFMLKTEQIRLGLRNIIGSHMTPQPHEFGIVVCHKQHALFSRLREPGKHPIPRQGVTCCMLVFKNGIRHFHHHHIGEMGHRRCCRRRQAPRPVTVTGTSSRQTLQIETFAQHCTSLSRSVTGRPVFCP